MTAYVVEWKETGVARVKLNCISFRGMIALRFYVSLPFPDSDVQMDGDIPISTEIGHGYGCKSMQSIAKKRNGFCTFAAVNGIFTLRVVLEL